MEKLHALGKFIGSIKRIHDAIQEGGVPLDVATAEVQRIGNLRGWTNAEKQEYGDLLISIWNCDVWRNANTREDTAREVRRNA